MEEAKLKSLLISPETTIKGAMQKLNETSERILFVVDKKGKLLGTVTDGDIRTGLINGLEFTDHIRKVMHKRFISVRDDSPDIQRNVKRLMIDYKIEQIPVLMKMVRLRMFISGRI